MLRTTSPEEAAMSWILGGALLLGLWVAAPTVRTLLRRDFEPVPRNDAIVFQAQQSSHP
jgi:hypothetical protein